MDSKAIETLSINAVKDSIVMSDFLDQFIAENDKEPSWDGFVYIYGNKSKKKDSLTGRMAVQVKGTVNNDQYKDVINFPVKTADLNNYLYDGGVVFFVVYINAVSYKTKIYFADLTPIKLRMILKDGKTNKTKNIKLKEFPNDGNEKATLFVNCLNNCRKQASFTDEKLYTLNELKEQGLLESISTSITGYVNSDNDYEKIFLNNQLYFYANIKGNSIKQPLEFVPDDVKISSELHSPITVNGILFYDNIKKICAKKSKTLKIGESFEITFYEEPHCEMAGSVIKYKNSSKLRVLVKDLEFMIAVLSANQLECNGVKIPIDFSKAETSNFNIEEQKEILIYHQKIVQVFDMLGAYDDIDLTKMTSNDKRNIDYLIQAFVEKEPVSGLTENLSPVIKLEIANFKFLLSFINVKGKKDTYNIYDFFRTQYKITYKNKDNKEVETSKYAILNVDDYNEITNLRLELLLPSYQCIKDDEEKYSRSNFVLLDLLNAYDKTGGENKKLLKAAEEFSEWLMKAGGKYLPYNIKSLNRLQVIRREREFVDAEIEELCGIIENNDSGEDDLVGAYLLMNNQYAANYHYRKLDQETQVAFKSYPIYYFWKS